MKYENLSDEDLQAKLDDAILKADPKDLDDDELDRRLELAETVHKSPDLLKGALDAAGMIAEPLATAADYPMGIVRSAVDAVHNVFSGEKSPSEAGSDVLKAFKGPSHAPTGQDLAQKAGIPDSLIPGTEIPQSAAAGVGVDMLAGIPAAKALSLAGKGAAKVARGALSADEFALKSIGTRTKDVEGMIMKADPGAPLSKVDDYVSYGRENVIKPLSSTEGMFKRAYEKLENVGTKIGGIRKKNQEIVQQWLNANRSAGENGIRFPINQGNKFPLKKMGEGFEQSVNEYVEGSFIPTKSLERIFARIEQEIPDPHYAEQVKKLITDKMEALHLKHQGNAVPIEEISRLKSAWQREINHGKEAADFSVREDAFNFLQREADRAIDNEILFADKYVQGNDLVKHNKLKEEYGILKNMTSNLRKKLAQEKTGKIDLKKINPLNSSRVQSAIASIPNPKMSLMPNKSTVEGGAFLGAGQVPNMREGRYKEPTIEGFRVNQTQEVGPQEAMIFEKDIQKSEMSNTEKAKRINLLRKHGRIYLGQ